jgi:transposase
MVGRRRRPGKQSCVRFADPPLSKEDPEWKELGEQVPANHLARTMVRGIERLDLSSLRESYSASGSLPHRPDLMLAIVLIELQQGHRSPAQWCRHARENLVLRWAGQGIRPSRSVWYEFRERVGPLLDAWNQQVLQGAVAAGQTTADRAAADGTSIEANASRHRLVNQERLQKRRDELATVGRADAQNQAPSHVPAWMAKTPPTRRLQEERYVRAAEHLLRLLAMNQQRSPHERRPSEKVVVSVSDPQAALGLDKVKVFRPLYNAQLLCDLDSPLILGYEVFAQSTDAATLGPMLERTAWLTGVRLREVLGDAGYVTGGELAACQAAAATLFGPWKENDLPTSAAAKPAKLFPKDEFQWLPQEQAYCCPQGHKLSYVGREQRHRSGERVETLFRYRCAPQLCRACPLVTRCTTSLANGRMLRRSEHEELIDQHRARMQTPAAKELYKLRRQTVELGFADLKEHRGLRRFSRRGLAAVRSELGLAVLAHNLRYLVPP